MSRPIYAPPALLALLALLTAGACEPGGGASTTSPTGADLEACGQPRVDGLLDGAAGCREYPEAPLIGMFADVYIRYVDDMLFVLNDWHLRDDAPADPEMYNLFVVETGSGSESWEIRVFGDQHVEVFRDGAVFNGVAAGGAGFSATPRHPDPHTLYEFAVPAKKGGMRMKEADPGPGTGDPSELLVFEPGTVAATLTPFDVIPHFTDRELPCTAAECPWPTDPCVEDPASCPPPQQPPPRRPFGSPCNHDSECDSGLCLVEAGYCTRTCADGCPEGHRCLQADRWAGDTIFACLPEVRPSAPGAPCTRHPDCSPTPDDKASWPQTPCLDYGDAGHFCGLECESGADCPNGYSCESTEGFGRQCVSDTGEGECWPAILGAMTTCSIALPEFGVICDGARDCRGSELSACTPDPKTCTATDDE